jgi:hypothetical protein
VAQEYRKWPASPGTTLYIKRDEQPFVCTNTGIFAPNAYLSRVFEHGHDGFEWYQLGNNGHMVHVN